MQQNEFENVVCKIATILPRYKVKYSKPNSKCIMGLTWNKKQNNCHIYYEFNQLNLSK